MSDCDPPGNNLRDGHRAMHGSFGNAEDFSSEQRKDDLRRFGPHQSHNHQENK